MPCYLFTYHGHGTWMPDHERGYVRRKEGVLATDRNMAENYRRNMCTEAVRFDRQIQQALIGAARSACNHLECRCHSVASEVSHVHILVSWSSVRTWQSISKSIKTRLTRELNQKMHRRRWLSKGSSRKHIADMQHFQHLMNTYLPHHNGLFWREQG